MARAAEQQAWLEQASGAAGPGQPALVTSLAEGATVTQACQRLARVSAWAPSEAVGDALVALLDAPAWVSASGQPFWSLLFFTLFHHGPSVSPLATLAGRVGDDHRLSLRRFDDAMATFFGDRIPRLVRALALDAERTAALTAAAVDVPEPAAIEAALGAGDHEAALGLALDAWRWLRTPSLAQLVQQLGARVERPPLPYGEGSAAWCAHARRGDPADVPRLLALVTGNVANEYVEALGEWPHHDPRMGAGAAERLIQPKPRWAPGRPMALQLAAMVVLHPCPLARASLERHAVHDLHFVPLCAAASARLEHLAARVDAKLGGARHDIEARFDALAWSQGCAPRADGRAEELLAAIYARPDDDPARLVYGDVLVEQQDPRGELIQLQCATRKLTREEKVRERQLIETHFAAWVGSLAPVIQPPGRGATWFERGFMHAAALHDLGTKRLGARAEDPAWRTVRELHLGQGCWPLVSSAAVSGVRWLTGLPFPRARLLADTMPELTTLELCADKGPPDWSLVADRRGLAELRVSGLAEPRVSRWVEVAKRTGEEMLAGLAGTPLARGLERLGLSFGLYPPEVFGHVADAFPGVELLLYQERTSRDPVFRLERGEGGHLDRGRYDVPASCPSREPYVFLHRVLADLPPGALSELVICAPRPPKQEGRIRNQLARLGPSDFRYTPRAPTPPASQAG